MTPGKWSHVPILRTWAVEVNDSDRVDRGDSGAVTVAGESRLVGKFGRRSLSFGHKDFRPSVLLE